MNLNNLPVRRRTLSLLALGLVAASSNLASANPYHFFGGPPGIIQWGLPAYFFEGVVPGFTDNVVINSIPYDDNWVLGAYANDLTILRGNWKFGASEIYLSHDLIVGDFQNAEQVAGYHNAYMTFSYDSLPYSNQSPPSYSIGSMVVNGNAIIGKSAGSDGFLTLLDCGTNPTFRTNDVFVGLYGNGTLNLQKAAMKYTNLYVGAAAGSNGAVVADGTPIPSYNQNFITQPVGLNNAIPTVTIGGAGNGAFTMKNGATTIGLVDPYNRNLQSSMGVVTLGALPGSTGAFTLLSKSSAYAYAMNVGAGGQGTLSLDDSTLYVAHTYANRGETNGGWVTAQGQPDAESDIHLTTQSTLTARGGVSLGDYSTMEVLGASRVDAASLLVEGGHALVSGFGSRLNDTYALIGQPGSSDFSSLTVQNDAAMNVNSMLKTGDNGLVQVFTDGTISVGSQNFDTLPGHIQVGFGGVLGGRGVFQASVDVTGGTIDPGFSPGTMHIDGDFNMSDGTIVIDLGGLTPGTEYDVLDVTGALNITGGTIDFESYNGFVPTAGSMFSFFHGGTLNIGPGVTILNDTGTGFAFNPLTGQGAAMPVPESTSLACVALGALSLLRRKANKGH